MRRMLIIIAFGALLGGCTERQSKLDETSGSFDLPGLPLGADAQIVVQEFDRDASAIRAASAVQNEGSDFSAGILARAGMAQAMRQLADRPNGLSAYDALQVQTYMADQIQQLDTANAAFLEKSLPSEGWFDSERYGEKVSNGAFLITQHSSDIRLMRLAVERMQNADGPSAADLRRYALLSDRIAVMDQRPQSYGTQLVCERGLLTMHPIDDAPNVEARRKAKGFTESLADYTGRIPNFEKSCF